MSGEVSLSEIWESKQDEDFFSILVQAISQGNCSAFVGAGLSTNAKYPTAQQLSEHFLSKTNLSEEAQGNIQNIPDFPDRMEKLKNILGAENFYQILHERFNPEKFNLQKTVDCYLELVKIPFKCFVTTNYDSLIWDTQDYLNHIKFDERQTYPNLIANNLDKRKIYHIHGMIDPNQSSINPNDLIITKRDL